VVEPLRSYGVPAKRRTSWVAYRYRAHSPDFEHILWPSKWPKEKLQVERQRYVDAGNPEGYAQEYLNYPIDDSVAFFRQADFLPYREDDLTNRALKNYIAVDLAISEKSRADYSVFIVGSLDDQGTLYIRDLIRARMDAKEIVDTFFALYKRYDPEMFTIEGSMIEKSIGPFLYEQMSKRGQYFNLYTENPTKDKETRARSIQARMRAATVKFHKSADWYSDLEQEMRQFPKSRHDDQVDAIAWLGLTLDKMVEAATPTEMAETEYQAAYEQSGILEEGRDEDTGY